jgi:hypothetical protein
MNNYEAFVYKWTRPDGFWYIGFHKGSIDDGYISSGEYFLEDYNKNPDLWTREILATGTTNEMYDYETKLLQESNAKDDSMSYNKHNNNFPYVANDPEVRAKMSASRKEYYRNNPDKHNSKRPEAIAKMLGDKNPMKNPEARAKVSASIKEYYRNNPDKHNSKRPEVRAKVSASIKEYYRNNPDKHNSKRPEVRAKMSASIKEYHRNNPDKHNSKRPEAIAKMLGDKNPMKNPEVIAKRRKTREMKKAKVNTLESFFG